MPGYFGSTFVQRVFALVIPTILASWLVTSPTVAGPASLFALLAVLMAFAWILQTIYKNARPAARPARAPSRR